MASALLAAAKARDRLGMAQIGARFPNPLANSIQETHMGPSTGCPGHTTPCSVSVFLTLVMGVRVPPWGPRGAVGHGDGH